MLRPRSQPSRPPIGKGPIYEIRQAMSANLGRPVSQDEMADAINLSEAKVKVHESTGSLPTSKIALNNLRQLAKKYNVPMSW